MVLVPGTLVSAASYDGVARLLRGAGAGRAGAGRAGAGAPGSRRAPDDAGATFDPVSAEWMRDVENSTLPNAAEAVARLVEQRGNGPAILVGHSTGAAIAARTAADHPAAVAGLVLLDSGPNMAAHASIEGMLAGLRAAETDAQWRAYAELNVSSGSPEQRESWIEAMVAFSRSVGAGPAVCALESQHATDFLASPLLGRCRSWGRTPARREGAPARPDAQAAAPASGTRRPVEVLHGELDPKRGPGDAHAWADVFPGAVVRMLPGCGHTPPLEAPEAVAAAVQRVAAALRGGAA